MSHRNTRVLKLLLGLVISLILFLPAAVPVQAAIPIYFDTSNIAGSGSAWVYAVAAGDLDNDGDLDLVSGDDSGYIVIWENDGTPFSGGWSSLTIGQADDTVFALAVGDLDNDGDLDIVSGDDDSYLVIWQNDGTPWNDAWSYLNAGEASDGINALAAGDFDRDGDLDLVTGDDDYYVVVWENDGTPWNNSWSSYDITELDEYVDAVAVGDFDQDGDLDIVSGDEDDDVIIWRNDGPPLAGSWYEQTVGDNSEIRSLAVGDFDQDGDLDIVSGDEDADVIIWENDGSPFDGGWNYRTVGERVEYIRSVAVGDFNNDGFPDIVSGDEAGELIVWENDGTPFNDEWSNQVLYTTSSNEYYFAAVTVGDLDNDGDPDIISGDLDNNVIVHRNFSRDRFYVEGAGGEVNPVNKIGLAVPWLVLAGLAAVGAVCIWRRRSSASK